jgi:hypothetical protein
MIKSQDTTINKARKLNTQNTYGQPLTLNFLKTRSKAVRSKSLSQIAKFSLNDQSLWGKGRGFKLGVNFADELTTQRTVPLLGNVEAGFKYKLEGFLSSGTVGINFPSQFDLSYSGAIRPGSVVSVNVQSTLKKKGNLTTELGASLVALANVFVKPDSAFLPEIKLGGKFDAAKIYFEQVKSPIFLDFGLGGSTRAFQSNTLIAKDQAFQAIDVPKAIALAAKVTRSGGLGIAAISKFLSDGGLGVKLGGNIQQQSSLTLQGFEVDWDGVKNGNELYLKAGDRGSLNIRIPRNYSSGDTFQFTPTVKPITELVTQFSVNAEVKVSYDLRKILPIPVFFNDSKVEFSPESSYRPIASVRPFDPFANAKSQVSLKPVKLQVGYRGMAITSIVQ